MLDCSVIDTNDEQFMNTLLPMVVILDGSVIDANDEHLLKTPSPIVVIVSGRVIVWRERQL